MTTDTAKQIRIHEDKILWQPGNISPSVVIETRFIKGRTVRVEHKKKRGK